MGGSEPSDAAELPLPLPAWLLATPPGKALQRTLGAPLSSWALVTALLLGAELALNALIVRRVPYTEIDWRAYVEEVEGVLVHGNYNYTELRGGTGPLVYPAGFVYSYSLLYYATERGANLDRAQALFVALYLATLAVVAAIYRKAAPRGFHPLHLGLLCVSKRIHSIFALRLFNDGPTMLVLYCAVLLFLHRRWTAGCVLFSLAFGMKMNIVLFAPALFLLLVAETGALGAAWRIALCGAVQLALGLPFLLFDAQAYLGASFNLSRTFKHHWSVNFRWVPCEPLPPERQTLLSDCEGLFTSKVFGLGLLLAMVGLMLSFAHWRWCRPNGPGTGGLLQIISGQGVSPFPARPHAPLHDTRLLYRPHAPSRDIGARAPALPALPAIVTVEW